MRTVHEIFTLLDSFAPVSTKLDFDNVGLLAGGAGWQVGSVLLSLDITDDVIDEAKELGAELIVSHHPLFFSLKSAASTDPGGAKLVELLSNRISAICMHTNLDAADGGVNDALAAALWLENAEPFEPEHIGRIGRLPRRMDMSEFLPFVKNALKSNGLRFYDAGREAFNVAVGGGSCGGFLEAAVDAGCDTFVTADIKYDVFLRAAELGVNLIDADHFCTENTVIPVLAGYLRDSFPDLEVHISRHGQTVRFI
ncbi:MAG: Nif3-like dinuclear metal center hexameric protein [Oscillospiraceae bacterium]|jgi:dinuclear metal center YbgI/SA1388 family protein|nr:Nif3-like dinuclear metal center hexameric protein [Oscillospiraceae bacterium]